MPDRSKVMAQTKRDTLVLQVWGWSWGTRPHPVKKHRLRKPQRRLRWDRQVYDDLPIRKHEGGGEELKIGMNGGIF